MKPEFKLYVADAHITWNGINLNPGDLYGFHQWEGLIYSHVPCGTENFVFFTRVNDRSTCAYRIDELPNISHWVTTDGRVFFEEIIERPNTYMPIIITTVDCWDTDLVEELMEQCDPNDEVALYVDGDEATFFIHPVYSSPDFNHYGECIETWCI